MHLKFKRPEGEINWNDEAKIIIGKINGLYPAPGAFFIYKGERYKILKAEIGQWNWKARRNCF
jgi:methionyl-tRNA formyltransferase